MRSHDVGALLRNLCNSRSPILTYYHYWKRANGVSRNPILRTALSGGDPL